MRKRKSPALLRMSARVARHPSIIRFAKDPFIHREIMGMVEDAELMGMDFDDPELMGGLIANVVKKISTAVRKRREAKANKGNTSIPTFSMQTSNGTATLGPGGFNYTGTVPQNIPLGNTGLQIAPVQTQSESILDKIKSNPALIAGIAAVPLLLMFMSKRGDKK